MNLFKRIKENENYREFLRDYALERLGIENEKDRNLINRIPLRKLENMLNAWEHNKNMRSEYEKSKNPTENLDKGM